MDIHWCNEQYNDSPVVMIDIVSLDTTKVSVVRFKEDMISLEVNSFPPND